jgi:sulfatase maturation enzyme AslB (radical SAM superfamily)
MGRLYSHLKFLRFTDNIDALRNRRVVPPVHIRIKPINHCNHNCWYCAYRADQLQLGEDMDLKDKIPEDKMFEIVDDIVEMGVKAVTFSGGGEPLIYKPLPDVIERLAAGGVAVAALSNGANLKGRMADVFAEHGTWIRISMDAWDGPSYAKSRSVREDEFARIIENLRAFAARNTDCILGVSYIVSHDNFEHIQSMCKLLKDVGVNHVKLAAAVVSNDVHENNLYHRKIIGRVTELIESAQEIETPEFTVLNHYHEAEERFDKDYDICPFLMFLTVIGADETVYTCQDKAYNAKGKLGSIKDISFKEFWFSEQNQARLFNVCPSKDCQHHCVTHAKNLALIDYADTPIDLPSDIDSKHGLFV